MARRLWLALLLSVPSIGVAFTLRTLIMPGPVIEAHARIEETCDDCHEDDDGETQNELCFGCHTEVRVDVAQGIGFHGRHPDAKDADCYTCHDEHEGRNADIVGLNMNAFAHVHTDFDLRGAHQQVPCTSCHVAGTEFRATSSTCIGCHANDDVHAKALGQTCETCHAETNWRRTSFDHGSVFPLMGKHAATACADCHSGTSFTAAPTDCGSCHRADDVHKGRNGAQCGSCHGDGAVAWNAPSFDHAARTGFVLQGSHGALACESCHVKDVSAALPSTCGGCHRTDDPHRGLLGAKCATCHNSTAWTRTSFDHSRVSDFALAGAHAELECTSCHTAGIEADLGRDCASCHADDPHRGQLGATCEKCHSQLAWSAPPRFDHDLVSFPLLGKHATLQCVDCHVSLAFHDVSGTCTDCHAEQDPHRGAFGNACATCHNPNDWLAWSFDHGTRTGFALDGAHERLQCAACHGGRTPPVARAAGAQACGQCHRQDDPHGGRFGADCASCHSVDSFSDIRRR